MTAFDAFWAAYPRREARKDAMKAWTQAGGDEHADAILAALDWQRNTDQWRRGYVPLAATYLRGERWTDENPVTVIVRVRAADAEAAKEATRAREAAYDAWEARKRQA